MSFISLGGGGSSKWSQITIDSDKDMGGYGLSDLKQVATGMVGGDLIAKGTGGILVRIPAGIANTVLTSQGSLMLPTWAPGGLYLNRYYPVNVTLSAPSVNKNTTRTHAQNVATQTFPSVYVMDVLDDPTHQLKLVTAPITLPGAQNKNTTRTHQQANSLTGKMPSQFDLNIVVAGAEAYNNTGSVYTDETANAQSAAANDMTLLPAVATANSAYYFGHAQKFDFLTLNIGTPGVGTGWTIAWEYWNGAWVALAGVTDGTSAFQAAAGNHNVVFTQPGDWATTAVNAVTLYWIRARLTAITTETTQPKGTQAWITISSHPIF